MSISWWLAHRVHPLFLRVGWLYVCGRSLRRFCDLAFCAEHALFVFTVSPCGRGLTVLWLPDLALVTPPPPASAGAVYRICLLATLITFWLRLFPATLWRFLLLLRIFIDVLAFTAYLLAAALHCVSCRIWHSSPAVAFGTYFTRANALTLTRWLQGVRGLFVADTTPYPLFYAPHAYARKVCLLPNCIPRQPPLVAFVHFHAAFSPSWRLPEL
jgi:hypothetical protein